MKLYHISRCRINSKIFSPRIPKYHNELENAIIPRISVSDSIEGCISSVNKWLGNIQNSTIKFDNFTEAWVYEFDSTNISPENLLSPHFIKDNYFIFDSPYTREHWIINQTAIPIKEYLIQLQNAEYKDTIFQHTQKEIKRLVQLNNKNRTFTVRRFKKLKFIEWNPEDYLSYVKQGLLQYLNYYKNQTNGKELLLKYIDFQISLRENSNDKVSMLFKSFYKFIQNKDNLNS